MLVLLPDGIYLRDFAAMLRKDDKCYTFNVENTSMLCPGHPLWDPKAREVILFFSCFIDQERIHDNSPKSTRARILKESNGTSITLKKIERRSDSKQRYGMKMIFQSLLETNCNDIYSWNKTKTVILRWTHLFAAL